MKYHNGIFVQPGPVPMGASGLFSSFTKWVVSSRSAGLAFVHCTAKEEAHVSVRERTVTMFRGLQ